MKNLDLSIVIRCAEDRRVFKCLDSIDENVEVIVSISENPEFQKLLEERGITYRISPRHNLSITSNIGFWSARNDKVIITDSDTYFKKGCIRALYNALDKYQIVRAKLEFKKDPTIPFSAIVGDARDYVNSLKVTYTPGLGFRKEVIKRLGGFLFNEEVPYAVDADLNYRVKKVGIPVCFLDNAVIVHDVESIKHDLKAAYRIGRGVALSAKSLYIRKWGKSIHDIERDLKGVKIKDLPSILRCKGLGVFTYQLIWDFVFHLGKNIEKVRGWKKNQNQNGYLLQ